MRLQSIQNNYANPFSNNTNKPENISFQKKGVDKIGKFFGEKYAQKLYNNTNLRDLSEKWAKSSDKMTQHMATAGSIITSSVYMYRTANNKDLDSDKRRTLVVNQGLCMVIPTICAYTVDGMLKDKLKSYEYWYSGKQNQKLASGLLSAAEAENLKKVMGNRLKGIKTLGGLATFTLIYRYGTPVIITPISNWIGDKINAKKKAAKAAADSNEPKELARA